tara:strand:- start:846 stop:1073 length:228 start_codon:yes stop_codon:yes gene_type:complete
MLEKLEKEREELLASMKQSSSNKFERLYKALQKENYELKAELARAKEDHQYDNLVHKKELEEVKKWNPRLDGSGK